METQIVIDSGPLSQREAKMMELLLTEKKMAYSTAMDGLSEEGPTLFFIDKKNLKKIKRFKNKMVAFLEDLNSEESSRHFLDKFLKSKRRAHLYERMKDGQKKLECARHYLETESFQVDDAPVKKIFSAVLALELLLLEETFSENTLDKWNLHFKDFVNHHPDLKGLSLISSKDLFKEEVEIKEQSLIYNLYSEEYYVLIDLPQFDLKKHAAFLDVFLAMISRALQVTDQRQIKNDHEADFWKKIFSKIPYPMAVISELGDLLIHNDFFAKIGILPKECLRFRDLENAEISQNFYKVRRIDFPIDLIQVSYFIFYTSTDYSPDNLTPLSEKVSSAGELGIISSSIAHELNNPLAGILAALTLLSLEDGWSPEALSELADMQSGAKRCKELVEIFLGFSKFSPATMASISIKNSLDQAINLLRFRMVESNLRLDIKYSPTPERFSHQVNVSIMSMIFYLIFSELMTAFAHHRLIAQIQHGTLAGEALDSNNEIILKIHGDFEYEDKIAQSKLIQHLLVFERLEISFLKQEIRLVSRC